MKILLLVMSVGFLSIPTGCDEETTYKVLSFFFDGVPKPGTEKPVDEPVSLPEGILSDSTKQKVELAIKRPAKAEVFFHKPYREKRCNDCHQTGFGQRLVAARVDLLCQTCHEDFAVKRKYTHGPVAVGQCLTCHNPHLAKNKYLLLRAGDKTCTYCHEEIDMISVADHQADNPLTCVSCHSPHFSDTNKIYLLEDALGEK